MSTTFLRLGLWIVILCLGVFVIDSSFPKSPLNGAIEIALLQKVLILAAALIIVGIIARPFEKKVSKSLTKNRCRICDTTIPAGAIYCRPHLRGVLEREDRRTHNTRIK